MSPRGQRTHRLSCAFFSRILLISLRKELVKTALINEERSKEQLLSEQKAKKNSVEHGWVASYALEAARAVQQKSCSLSDKKL